MSKRVRVAEIVFSLDIEAEGGGITRFASALSQALEAEQFEAVFYGLWRRDSEVEKELTQRLAERGVQAFACAPWDDKHPYSAFIQAYQNLRAAIKNQPVDIVHSHSEFGDVAAMLLKLEGITPVIVRTLHNGLPMEWRRRPVRRFFLSYLLYPLVFNQEIGVSRHITEYLDQRWLAKLLGHSGMTIHNALDLSRFAGLPDDRQNARQELGIPQNAYLVGTVGRLGEEKGYDLLIQAVAEILREIDDFYLVIIGDGKQALTLRQQASSTGISQRVIFTGARADIERLLGSMDLFVCSSRWEGLSTAVMEAMAAGLPIVATDIAGNRELLSHGKNAWLVPTDNATALAKAILFAKHNPGMGQAFSQQARSDVHSYKIDRIASQHGRLYMDLLNRQLG